jgi:hypothetical protein
MAHSGTSSFDVLTESDGLDEPRVAFEACADVSVITQARWESRS